MALYALSMSAPIPAKARHFKVTIAYTYFEETNMLVARVASTCTALRVDSGLVRRYPYTLAWRPAWNQPARA